MFDMYWVIAALALLVGSAVQTAIGFGLAVIAAPIIVLFKPEWVPATLTMVALVLSIQNTWNQRSGLEVKLIAPAMISRLPGTVIGAWILLIIPVQMLQVLVSSMVFVAIFVTLFAKPFKATKANLGIAGFVSGISGTTTSIGGPPMALVMQHGSSHTTRANLSLYFTFSCLTSLLSYKVVGLLDSTLWVAGLSFIPVAYVGFFIGKKLRRWVDDRFRVILLSLCSVSAIIALYGAVF
jgi:uncharacterized membrane protein YfcA